MDIEERLRLIKRAPTEEILTEEELKSYLERGFKLRHYIGFEISGWIHIGTGLVCMSKVVDLQRAGIECTIFLADIHSWINEKLGGDLDLIREVAAKYYVKTLKKCIEVLGGDPERVKFVLGSELYHNNDEYWMTVLDVAKNVNLARVQRSITILGRKMGEGVPFAWLVYPIMQVADIFALGVHIAHAGIDQRKAHVIAREVAPYLRFKPLILDGERIKPIALHHHLLTGLSLTKIPESKEELIEYKMSKSKPESCIFLHDTPDVVKRKILKAFCPPREITYNPVMDIAKTLLFRDRRKPFIIERPPKYGGTIEVWSYEELEKIYVEGKLHPLDLKNAVVDELNRLLEPLHKWFSSGEGRKLITEMKELLEGRITR